MEAALELSPQVPRLLLFEGIAGAGKSTLAARAHELLQSRGVSSTLVLEGNVEHPADYESVAHLDGPGYRALLEKHPAASTLLAECLEVVGDDYLVSYGRLRRDSPDGAFAALLSELSALDVYETSAETYRRLALARWTQFAAMARAQQGTWIFDCCFLQNPLTVLLARLDLAPEVISDHVAAVAGAIEALQPVILYLDPGPARPTLDRAAAERPASWLDFFVWYHTGQRYGIERSLTGLDGTAAVLEARKEIEARLLLELPVSSLRLDTSNGWSDAERALEQFIADAWPVAGSLQEAAQARR